MVMGHRRKRRRYVQQLVNNYYGKSLVKSILVQNLRYNCLCVVASVLLTSGKMGRNTTLYYQHKPLMFRKLGINSTIEIDQAILDATDACRALFCRRQKVVPDTTLASRGDLGCSHIDPGG